MIPSPRSISPLWALVCPNATVFLSNGAIMVLELVAGRIIAPYLGMSLYTWTTIIGVIMGGMALGNYFGGAIAERWRPTRALAVLFLASALGCAAVLPLNNLIGASTPLWNLVWPARIFIHVGLVFTGPALLLGMINPVVAKMALQLQTHAGRAVGDIFAWGVIGSLSGTFLAGYYLVYSFGVQQIAWTSAGTLALLGMVYAIAAWRSPQSDAALSETQDETAPRLRAVSRWSRIAPYAIVFCSNAAFMTLELAASRMLSREFGASLYTWTTVIGVVLAGVALGNYLGGRIADRRASRGVIVALFLLASAATLASPFLARLIGTLLDEVYFLTTLSWPLRILTYMSFAFFLPSMFIGCLSPIVVKRALEEGVAEGRAVGNIYAWGSVGSIVATFLTGYILIDVLWPRPVVALTALLLAAAAMLYAEKKTFPAVWAVLCTAALLLASVPWAPLATAGAAIGLHAPAYAGVIYEDESQYSYIAVVEDEENPNLREMLLDKLTHSQIDIEDPAALKYEYEWVYAAVMAKFYPDSEALNAFVIGGGGYAFPHYLEVTRPESHVVVAEIDPAVTEAAFAAFGLPRATAISIYDMDARNHVADLIERRIQGEEIPPFDCVFGDSINDYTVPYHLTTLEFTRQVRSLMRDDGIYMLNMIDMFRSGLFLSAVVQTCREVFSFVYVFNTGRPTTVRDTFIVVCSASPLNLIDVAASIRETNDYTGELINPAALDALIKRNGPRVLTDNYAPVENLLAPVVRARTMDRGELDLAWAERYVLEGNTELAMVQVRAALETHPEWPRALELLAKLLLDEGDAEGAVEAMRKALEIDPEYVPAHRKRGMEALQAQAFVEARTELNIAVQLQPDDAGLVYNLGAVCAAQQDLDAAIAAWRQALTINPDHTDALHNLALAYTVGGDYEGAWEYVTRLRALGEAIDPGLLETLQQASGRSE